jgi:site-specific DNA recombinase
MTTMEPLRTALYLRISSDQRDGAGVERQERECRELADRLGWHITRVLIDNDVSAYTGKRREDYETLLDLIRTGQIDAVITWHTDRMRRRPVEQEQYIELCDKQNIANVAVQIGQLDLTTASGQIVHPTARRIRVLRIATQGRTYPRRAPPDRRERRMARRRTALSV